MPADPDAAYAALFAGSPDAILMVDGVGRCADANPVALDLLGYAREDVLGMRVADFVAEGPAWVDGATARFRADGRWQGELGLRRKDASIVPVEAWSVAIPGPGGPLRAVFARDLTGRRAAEEWFRTAFVHAPIGMALITPEGRYLRVNPALCALTGYAEPELLARTYEDITHPDDVAGDRALHRRMLAGEIPAFRMEKRYLRKDGRHIWVELTAAVVRDADGVPLHVVRQLQDVTARKAAEDVWRAGEARFRALLERLPVMVYEQPFGDDLERSRYVNPRVADLLGYAPDEWTPDWLSRVHPDDLERVRAASDRADATGEAFAEEYRERAKDGSWVWVRDEAVLVRDDRGEPDFWLGAKHDVTERVRLEAQLRESEARFRSLVEQVPAVVYAVPAGGGPALSYVSPRVADVLGYAAEEVLARPGLFREEVHPEDREAAEAADAAAEASGGAFAAEYRVRRKDGSWAWVGDEAVLVRDGEGNPRQWQGLLTDVTARRAAEADRARLAAIVESADDAILSKDLDGTVRSWNASAERMYGWAAAEILGRPITTIVPADKREELADILARLARGERVERLETARVARDGRRLDISLTVSPLRDAGGRVVGASVIARDVTDQKRAEAELRAAKEAAEEANRLKSAFLSTMSHELRTPLNAVLGYAHLLLDGFEGELAPGQADGVRQIAQGADRLLALVNDVLDLSRIQAGMLELAPERVDLAGAVASVATELAPLAATKGLALDVDVPDGLGVLADPRRLHQVLLNLVGNAVKFTEAGQVRIEARPVAEGVEVAVRDTGIGIPAEVLPRVFDEFRQADGSTTRTYGGSGLGLAISKRLVELHGGTIRAESEPGVGSTFMVTLPAA